VVQPRWRTKAGRAVVGPEDADLCLLEGAHRRRNDAVATYGLHLVERRCVVDAVECGRWWCAELIGRLQDKRLDLVPIRAQRDRRLTDGILSPISWLVTGKKVDADTRLCALRAIIGAQHKNGCRGTLPKRDSQFLRASATQPIQVAGELLVEARLLRREECSERIMRGLGDRRVHRRARCCRG